MLSAVRLWCDDRPMSAPDLTAEMMTQFADSGSDRHLTLLLGAGASTSSGLPDWNELAIRLLVRSGSVASVESAELLVKRQDPLLVAEAARQIYGEAWDEGVEEALYEGRSDPKPSALHVAVAGYLLDGLSGDTTVLTLNFDTLIESAISQETTTSVEARTNAEVQGVEYVVYHLHGVVVPDGTRDIVLTLSDFNELLGDSNSWQLEVVNRAVRQGALVIAGTSYRDPDLRRWLHVALADQPEEHTALVLLAREGFKLSRHEFSEVEQALADQWRSVGLVPIVLEDFSDAAQIIRELRHVHDEEYLSPQERSQMIWDAHVEHFDALQVQYSDCLSEDAEKLCEAFDVEQLNLTLWLANAKGFLARWAAHDRYYRSVHELRLVESGHDSHWIAGHALGAEDILFKDLEVEETRRWSTVLAVPVRVAHSDLPEFATAVLSVGLPGAAKDYEPYEQNWLDAILTIANSWSDRLIREAFPETASTLK